MALWQYSLFVIPKFNDTIDNLSDFKDEDGLLDDEGLWQKSNVSTSFFNNINKILPLGKSWSENLIVYGDLETNCFEIYHKNDLVASASFRIDFTSDYEYILYSILDFVQLNDLQILDEELNIIKTNTVSIKNLIENSRQYKLYHKLLDVK